MKIKLGAALVLVATLTAAWLAAHGYSTFATPFCTDGATSATTAAQVETAVAAGEDVCVTAAITTQISLSDRITAETGTGDLTQDSTTVANVTGSFETGMRIAGDGLARGTRVTAVGAGTLTISPAASSSGTGVDLTGADDRQIGTSDSGSIGAVDINGANWVTLHVRGDSMRIVDSEWIWVDNSIMGGTADDPTSAQVLFMPAHTEDVIISNSDFGFTVADDTGNTGYAMRVYGDNDRMQIVGNKIHDIAADAVQGFGGADDVLFDRNEIGPVGANPGSDEHSDAMQVTSNGPNLRITNNWFHEQGYYNGEPVGNSGIPYLHGLLPGDDSSLLFENNLIENSRGRMEVCGLGTPDPNDYRSDVTIRNNTIVDLGQAFPDFPGFEWDCDEGTGNVIENNIAVDPDSGFAQNGSTDTFTLSNNLFGLESLVTLDADGNCTSTNCNPPGVTIGYRKPSGVNW